MARQKVQEQEDQPQEDQNQGEPGPGGENQDEGQTAEQAAEQTKANEKEAIIKAAFVAGTDSGEFDEDAVKLSMINAGATFKNVTRLFNQFLVDAGLAISKEDRDKIVTDKLAGLEFVTEEQFDTAVKLIEDSIEGASTKSASALVRGYAKKNNLEHFIKPKVEGEGQKNSFVHKFYDWLAANPAATEAEAHDFIFGENGHEATSQNVKNYERMHQNVRALANRIATAPVAEAQ